MVISEPHDSIYIKLLIQQNGPTDQDQPTLSLNATNCEEAEKETVFLLQIGVEQFLSLRFLISIA